MIEYRETVDGVESEHLAGFFEGWPSPPSPETHLRILRGSPHIVLAREAEDGRVVGFITALSDGVLCAYVPLLEVLSSYQGRGIGSELVRRMQVRLSALYMVDLLCDEELQPFYERLGMRPAAGMMLRNYDRQAGADGTA